MTPLWQECLARSQKKPAPGRIDNQSEFGERYFGIHMAPGLAEYEKDGKPHRRLVTEETIRKMNPTMEGKPFYVLHQEHDMERLQETADGWVVRSFYNPLDGRTWAEFIATSEAGKKAVADGWTLSCSYYITSSKGGGQWHNLDYDEEVTDGYYDHLAIVPNPRYEESRVLTPDEFRLYNERIRAELPLLVNSKKENAMPKFNLFKKQKVENADDLAQSEVEFSDGTTMKLSDVVQSVENAKQEADRKAKEEAERAKGQKKTKAKNDAGEGATTITTDKPAMGLDAEIMVGTEKMTVAELVQKFLDLQGSPGTEERAGAAASSKEADNESDDDDSDEKKKEKEKSENAKIKAARVEAMKRAQNSAADEDVEVVDTITDQLERGRARYGSGQAART